MKKIQIQLTDKQYLLLKEISTDKNISLEEAIREAIFENKFNNNKIRTRQLVLT